MSDGIRGARRRLSSGLSRVRKLQAPASELGLVALRRRVTELEDEIQECRRLNVRLAELTDIVQELLVPLAERDEAKVRERLDRYAAGL
jgi:hypothetical protein